MITNGRFLIFSFCLLCLTGATVYEHPGIPDFLQAASLKPYGRYVFNEKKSLGLVGSAVHFGVSFQGRECRIFASIPDTAGHNYLQYELDGVYQRRLKIAGNTSEPLVISAEGEGIHTLWIYKATEAHSGTVFIEKLTGKNIKPLERQPAPLIEFIGNSITCGAAADPSEVACGTGVYHDQHNAYYAYGPRVTRALRTRFVLSSVSGIGIYRNWNSNGPAMPEVYEKTDFQEHGTLRWDFKLFTPAIISIALGTNDFSNGDGTTKRQPFDSAMFVNAYCKFVRSVKSIYPGAQIALLSSPMVKGERRVLLQNCLSAVKNNMDASAPADKPIVLFFFEPMEPHGCSGHPSVEDHAILAKELEPFFRRLLK